MSGNLTIKQAAELLHAREISSRELTMQYLDRIKHLNPGLNAFITITESEALRDADEADRRLKEGDNGVLTGVPIAIKDNILIKGSRTTAGSRMLQNYTAAYDATVIQLLRNEGAVFVGKTNLDEFAMGASSESSAFGPTTNPHDTGRVPGGSSGGSAVAVAADCCVAALGSDTGGSVRQPAGFCGVVGLKPTYGRVSRSGLISMASSLDQIGPLTKNVWDAAAMLEAIAAPDAMDAMSHTEQPPRYTRALTGDLKGLTVGVPNEYFAGKGLDADVEKCVRDAIFTLERLGAKIGGVSLPHAPYALAVYYVLMPSEVSSNLARYDGIRYGFSTAANPPPVRGIVEGGGNVPPPARGGGEEGVGEEALNNLRPSTLLDVYEQSRGGGFGKEVQRRMLLGTYTLSAGYYDAYYKKAQQVRARIADDFKSACKEYDVLVSPTTSAPAFKLGEKEDPVSMYLGDLYTVSANITGMPAISVPCGTVERDGKRLPVGFQIMGRHFEETTVLKVADAFERCPR